MQSFLNTKLMYGFKKLWTKQMSHVDCFDTFCHFWSFTYIEKSIDKK